MDKDNFISFEDFKNMGKTEISEKSTEDILEEVAEIRRKINSSKEVQDGNI